MDARDVDGLSTPIIHVILSTMSEAVAPTPSRRLPFWAMIIALVICALAGVFVLLWFKLPTWVPAWVVEHSPWVDPIVRAVDNDRTLDESARVHVTRWGPSMTPALHHILRDERPAARALAIDCLGMLKDETAIEQLITIIDHDPEQECRSRAIEALGRIGSPRSIPRLVEILRQNQGGQAEAFNALMDLPASAVADELLPLLRLKEGNQYYGIRLAGRLADERMTSALEAIAREPIPGGDQSEAVAIRLESRPVRAVGALLVSPNPTAVPTLIGMLSDVDKDVRLSAVSGLFQAERETPIDPQLIESLVAALNDDSTQVREVAALAIRQSQSDHATKRLLAILSSPDVETRRLAVMALGRRGAPDDIIAALTQRLGDDDSRVRAFAINALGETRNPAILEPLLAHYATVDDRSKRAIRYLVTNSPYCLDAGVFPYLLLGLADSSETVHEAARRVVGALPLSEEQRRQVDEAIANRTVKKSAP